MMKNIVIKVGDGRSPSGKILDRETTWYRIEEKEKAIEDAVKRHKILYISENNKKYFKVSVYDLKNNW